MGHTAVKKQFSSVTVEFPVDEEIAQLEPNVMFEMVKQLVAKGIGCHPDKVWIKSVSNVTQFEQDPVPPGYS